MGPFSVCNTALSPTLGRLSRTSMGVSVCVESETSARTLDQAPWYIISAKAYKLPCPSLSICRRLSFSKNSCGSGCSRDGSQNHSCVPARTIKPSSWGTTEVTSSSKPQMVVCDGSARERRGNSPSSIRQRNGNILRNLMMTSCLWNG